MGRWNTPVPPPAGATSIYKWEGKIEESEESVLVIKTMGENQEAVTALVNREHSYDTPEVVFLPVVGGSEAYLKWVQEVTTDESERS